MKIIKTPKIYKLKTNSIVMTIHTQSNLNLEKIKRIKIFFSNKMSKRKELNNFWEKNLKNFNGLKQELEDLIELNRTCAHVFRQLIHNHSKTLRKNKAITKETLDNKNVFFSIFSKYSELIIDVNFSNQYKESLGSFEENRKKISNEIHLIQSLGNEIENLSKNKSSEKDIQDKYFKYCQKINEIQLQNIQNFIFLFTEFSSLYSTFYKYGEKLSYKYKHKKIDNSKEFALDKSILVKKSNEILMQEKHFKKNVMNEYLEHRNEILASCASQSNQIERSVISSQNASNYIEFEYECFNKIDFSRVAPNTVFLSSKMDIFKLFTSNQLLIEPVQNDSIQAVNLKKILLIINF